MTLKTTLSVIANATTTFHRTTTTTIITTIIITIITITTITIITITRTLEAQYVDTFKPSSSSLYGRE